MGVYSSSPYHYQVKNNISSGGGGSGTPGGNDGNIQYRIDANTFGGYPYVNVTGNNFIINNSGGTATEITLTYDSASNQLELNNTTLNKLEFFANTEGRIFVTNNTDPQNVETLELYTSKTAEFVVLNNSTAETLLTDNAGNLITENGTGNNITVPPTSSLLLTKHKTSTKQVLKNKGSTKVPSYMNTNNRSKYND